MGPKLQADAIFDPFAERLIRKQARRVVDQAGLPMADQEDIAQDLRFHLLTQAPKYDDTRGRRTTFSKCVIERKATALLHKARGRTRGVVAVDDSDLDQFDQDVYRRRTGNGVQDPGGRSELRLDIKRCLRTLPPADRALVHLLMYERITDIARLTGVPRSTLYGRIARLREVFARANLHRLAG